MVIVVTHVAPVFFIVARQSGNWLVRYEPMAILVGSCKGFTGYLDFAIVIGNDSGDIGQSQAGPFALRLGRVKAFEDVFLSVLFDPLSIALHHNFDPIITRRPCEDLQSAVRDMFHGVDAVGNQVRYRLLNVLAITVTFQTLVYCHFRSDA